MRGGSKAWMSDPNHPHYIAGKKAMKKGNFEFKMLILLLFI